jgi:hypothetical protein
VNFISQTFYYESSQLNPPNKKTWSVSAMALMSFLDTIPDCNNNDWIPFLIVIITIGNLLDAYILFEDLSGLADFVIESDVCYSADFKQKLVDPKNRPDAMARSDASAGKEADIKEVQGLINRGCFKIVDHPAKLCQLHSSNESSSNYYGLQIQILQGQ